MPSINLLSREISELIAAGEVIERPSSVIKELVENSIDAGSSHITVEIKRGGSTFIRITDDGCGISFEDTPKAFLRHATSKITTKEDLDGILTLGFRGEALASVCAVSKVEIMTKQKDDELGTHYVIEGSEEILHEKTGCPDGTTIIIRDLFYNVPARQKFMKKDTSEGNMVCSIVDKIALSHPEISFKMIRDNKQTLSTAGDGNLYSSIFAVYGKNFVSDMIPVEYEQDGVKVSGYCVKPLYSKANRVFQNFFVNDRYVKSQICAVALEEAYKGVIMTGKFPACVLKIHISPDIVDVNVHPAKVEIRFSDDKPIYNCIYFAVKSALMKAGMVYDFQLERSMGSGKSDISPQEKRYEQMPLEKQTEEIKTPVYTQALVTDAPAQMDLNENTTSNITTDDTENKTIRTVPKSHNLISSSPIASIVYKPETEKVQNKVSEVSFIKEETPEIIPENKEECVEVLKNDIKESAPEPEKSGNFFRYIDDSAFITPSVVKEKEETTVPDKKENVSLRLIGEAFKGYIICELDEKIIIIDKHAAHERIIFERLKGGDYKAQSQMVMCPEGILLSLDEAQALIENKETLENMGFKLCFENSPYIRVEAVPVIIAHMNMDLMIPEIAENLRKNKLDPRPEAIDDILHTIACKAAIKINDKNLDIELQKLAEDVYNNENIRHCPHGRPVMFTITKYELEKQFRRKV